METYPNFTQYLKNAKIQDVIFLGKNTYNVTYLHANDTILPANNSTNATLKAISYYVITVDWEARTIYLINKYMVREKVVAQQSNNNSNNSNNSSLALSNVNKTLAITQVGLDNQVLATTTQNVINTIQSKPNSNSVLTITNGISAINIPTPQIIKNKTQKSTLPSFSSIYMPMF